MNQLSATYYNLAVILNIFDKKFCNFLFDELIIIFR